MDLFSKRQRHFKIDEVCFRYGTSIVSNYLHFFLGGGGGGGRLLGTPETCLVNLKVSLYFRKYFGFTSVKENLIRLSTCWNFFCYGRIIQLWAIFSKGELTETLYITVSHLP